jgi:thioredoxin reductase (NADPH)
VTAISNYDVIIIGGGPAGMSAALWSADLGMKAVLIERDAKLGGQLARIFNPINNYLGVSAINGAEMLERFLASLDQKDFDLQLGSEVVSVDLERRKVELDNSSIFQAKAVIVATGVRRRKLGVPGEEEFVGKGILTSGAKEAEKVKGREVVIIGGGDAALENALILSQYAKSVTLVHRRREFRARKEFVEAIGEKQNISTLKECTAVGFKGTDSLASVEIESVNDHAVNEIDADFALIRIGVQPNSELFRAQLETDENGYILTTANCQTNVENILAAGDVANPNSLTISTASGTASIAASGIFRSLNKRKTYPKI